MKKSIVRSPKWWEPSDYLSFNGPLVKDYIEVSKSLDGTRINISLPNDVSSQVLNIETMKMIQSAIMEIQHAV